MFISLLPLLATIALKGVVVDAKGGAVEVRNLDTGAISTFAVNVGDFGRIAFDQPRSRVVYVTQVGSTWQLKQVNINTGVVTFLDYTSQGTRDIEVDPATGDIYLAQQGWGIYVFRAGRTSLVQLNSTALSVEIDPFSGDLYWTTDAGSRIWRRKSGVNSVVVAPPVTEFVTDFVVDERNRKLYWSQDGSAGKFLYSSGTDGSNVTVVRSLSNTDPNSICSSYGMSIDDSGRRLYFACTTTIESLDLFTNANVEIQRVSGTVLFTDIDATHTAPALKAWKAVAPMVYSSLNLANTRSSGFVVTPSNDSYIRSLGGLFNGPHTVRLWNNTTGAQLASALVWGNNTWSYVSIAPVQVKVGTHYTISVDGTGSGGAFDYFPSGFPNYPIGSGNMIFEDAVEGPLNQGSVRPTMTLGGWMAGGIPDVEITTP